MYYKTITENNNNNNKKNSTSQQKTPSIYHVEYLTNLAPDRARGPEREPENQRNAERRLETLKQTLIGNIDSAASCFSPVLRSWKEVATTNLLAIRVTKLMSNLSCWPEVPDASRNCVSSMLRLLAPTPPFSISSKIFQNKKS